MRNSGPYVYILWTTWFVGFTFSRHEVVAHLGPLHVGWLIP